MHIENIFFMTFSPFLVTEMPGVCKHRGTYFCHAVVLYRNAPLLRAPSRSLETILTCTMIWAVAYPRLLHFGDEQHLPLTNGSAAAELLTSLQHGRPGLCQMHRMLQAATGKTMQHRGWVKEDFVFSLIAAAVCRGLGRAAQCARGTWIRPAPWQFVFISLNHILEFIDPILKAWNNLINKYKSFKNKQKLYIFLKDNKVYLFLFLSFQNSKSVVF